MTHKIIVKFFAEEAVRLSGEQFVPLSRELAFIGQYLDIQQMRFQDRLRVVVDVRLNHGGDNTTYGPLLEGHGDPALALGMADALIAMTMGNVEVAEDRITRGAVLQQAVGEPTRRCSDVEACPALDVHPEQRDHTTETDEQPGQPDSPGADGAFVSLVDGTNPGIGQVVPTAAGAQIVDWYFGFYRQ